MHELGVIIEVVKTVEKFAEKNSVKQIDTLVLQIGELSSMIPQYIESCYPAAVDGTLLEKTKLKIEVLPGNGMCRECGKIFNLLKSEGKCPGCGVKNFKILSGKEFMIKEIVAC